MNYFILLFTLFLFSCNSNFYIYFNNISYKNNETFLLKIKEGSSIKSINDLNKKLGILDFKLLYPEINLAEIKASDNNIDIIKTEYLKNNFVEYIEKDTKLKTFSYKYENLENNDKSYTIQWNMEAIKINKELNLNTGKNNVTVAVIDSGVDINHPDLKNNLLPLIDILKESGKEDIYDFGNLSIDYSGKDGNGHGTHVAGIISSIINTQKRASSMTSNVKILPIKVANYDGGTDASLLIKGIIKAIEKKVKVINLSIGASKENGNNALEEVVKLAISKGIVFVAATGNESNRSKGIIEEVNVPASYDGVIAVSAFTEKNKIANYSNAGSQVKISAPGGGNLSKEGAKIYSTWPTYKTYIGYKDGIIGPYAYDSGTSMASPHVAGVATLLFSKYPNITSEQVKLKILANTTDMEQEVFNNDFGYGKLNAYDSIINGSHDKKSLL